MTPRGRGALTRDYLIAILAAGMFATIATRALTGGPSALDMSVRGAVHSVANPLLTGVMKVITNLGSVEFLLPLGILIALLLIRAGRRRDTAIFAAAVLGANVLDQGMKLVFHRVRPETFFDYPMPSTFSFPSGHAFVSYCFYLSLAEVLIPREWPHTYRAIAWAGAIFTTGMIGLSRIYLGMHYPSDVLAGYAAAIAWLALVRAVHRHWWQPAAAPIP